MQPARSSGQSGFNLIEAAIVLGIVGLVVAGIWAAAAAAYENMRQQTASKDLLLFAQNIRNFYAGSNAGTIDLIIPDAINSGWLPRDMIDAGRSSVHHP